MRTEKDSMYVKQQLLTKHTNRIGKLACQVILLLL